MTEYKPNAHDLHVNERGELNDARDNKAVAKKEVKIQTGKNVVTIRTTGMNVRIIRG